MQNLLAPGIDRSCVGDRKACSIIRGTCRKLERMASVFRMACSILWISSRSTRSRRFVSSWRSLESKQRFVSNTWILIYFRTAILSKPEKFWDINSLISTRRRKSWKSNSAIDTIGMNHPTYFIADIAANHDGDLERAKLLIRLAKEAGADAAKFQNFDAPKIVSDYGFKP